MKLTHELGNPPGGVEPSYRHLWPCLQRDKYTDDKCSAISWKNVFPLFDWESVQHGLMKTFEQVSSEKEAHIQNHPVI